MVSKDSDTAHWHCVKRLVADALELEPDGREAFVVAATRDDRHARARALELLANAEQTGAFMVSPVSEDPARYLPELAVLPAGARIGAYRIVRAVGRGGSSVVYEAVQAAPERRVALKVLTHLGANAESAARFKRESEVLARLDHPSIAKIYEAGSSTAGLTFIAMEWLEGARTIRDHALDEKLDSRAILELARDICGAVEHGHSRGVVHRDLKPGNVLVDLNGRIKLIDFGIARLEDEVLVGHELTRQGSMLGTLSYMSPEQCPAPSDPSQTPVIDARSDVYSLGVLFYELLTGSLPYPLAGQALPAALEFIRSATPRRPRAIATNLAVDVEAMLLKCLAKDPQGRYGSAGELGNDIDRYLANEPVEARPPSHFYDAGLFARRHRAMISTAVVVVLAIMTVLATSLSSALEVADVERSERAKSQVVTRFLGSILSQANPALSGPDVTMAEALDDAAARVDVELASSPEAQIQVHTTIADAYSELGLHDAAVRHMERVVELARTLWPDSPAKTACNLDVLGRELIAAERPKAAVQVLEEARRMFTLDPETPEFLPAISANMLSGAHLALGQLEQSEENARHALEVFERTFGPQHESVAAAHVTLARIHAARGEHERAVSRLRSSVSIYTSQLGPDSLRTARLRLELAELLKQAGEDDAAVAEARAVEALFSNSLPAVHPDRDRLAHLIGDQE